METKEEVKKNMLKSVDKLKEELRKIHTGRANPEMVSDIQTSAYGTQMPINQLSTISVTDPRTITVHPWDKGLIESILKSISDSDKGFNAVIDGDIVRISIPPLSEENRKEYVKLLKKKAEECRIAMRNIRQTAVQKYDRAKEAKEISEEEAKKWRSDLDELISEMNKQVEDISAKKEEEIMTI